jgi:hypothetical protein
MDLTLLLALLLMCCSGIANSLLSCAAEKKHEMSQQSDE